MASLAVSELPVEVPRSVMRGAQWIKPKLVCEIEFTEFTNDGSLRDPGFIALREDKPASEVRLEMAKEHEGAERNPGNSGAGTLGIAISSADRVIYPGSDLTKGDLAAYYARIQQLMLADIAKRPISLVRCPQGLAGDCFFQKHDSGGMGEHVKRVPIKEADGKTKDYLYVEDGRGILSCVQMGTIEFHGWGSRVGRLEFPDRLVFDLDPDEGLDFDNVKAAATRLRALLADLGLATFPLLTGGKGIHVIAPLDARAGWPKVKSFAERFSRAIAEAEPGVFTANIRKEQRTGRIFIDWLRNQRGATAITPYSARAREGAPVATPVAWQELEEIKSAAAFSIRDADDLQRRAGSKWLSDWGQVKQKLPKA